MRGFFQSKLYEAIEDIAKAIAAYAVVIYGASLVSRWWRDVRVGVQWILALVGWAPNTIVGLHQVVATVGAIGIVGMVITRQLSSRRRGVL